MRSATCCWVQPRSLRAALSSRLCVAYAAFLTMILSSLSDSESPFFMYI